MHEHDYIHQVIEPIIIYYKKLDVNNRIKFVQRVQYFASNFEFAGIDGFEMTDEVKYLLCCPLTQITFGLEEFDMHNFSRIVVTPGLFYAPRSQLYMKGGTFKSGLVMISWDNFYEGYLHPDDNYNLGLHEFAHVYKLCIDTTKQFDMHLQNLTHEWEKVGNEIFLKMQNSGAESFLREYAGTNPHEFFAVCVEYFFEVPQKLMQTYPELYDALCNLLNQNPMNAGGNYYHHNAIGRQQEVQTKPKNISLEARNFEPSNFVFPFLLSGFFAVCGWVPFMYLLDHQLISITNTILIVVALGLSFYYFINARMGYQSISNKFNLAFVCITVLGMPLMMLALFLNSNITLNEPKSIQLEVMKVTINTPPDPDKWRAIVEYKKGLFDNYYFVRRMKYDDAWKQWKEVIYKVDQGCFGIYVVKEIKFIKHTIEE